RASFRFRLAAGTLASGCVLGATSCTQDFHPLERARAERTEKGRRGVFRRFQREIVVKARLVSAFPKNVRECRSLPRFAHPGEENDFEDSRGFPKNRLYCPRQKLDIR
ncbi:MAG: hypothetical protein SOT69_07210, partial [Mesosutterella sp.]|nr:hypothetical protein [Mesosutterella sp.]